ncbi:MAG: phosphoadenosine phosphosulfate reductase family protein [Ardenticatenales bacterium]|nr:phosphoadenosine phosphosulfate reductase family protein [Ardenticatenales bacterium]
MNPQDRALLTMHSRLERFGRKVEEARQTISDALLQCDNPYVAFSAGKDSAALLHLVHEIAPTTPGKILLWAGESQYMNNYSETLVAWGVMLPELQIVECVMRRESWDESSSDRWATLAEGHDAYFVGLRASESNGRRLTLRQHGTIYRVRESGLLRICPLAWWSDRDVGAYIVQNNLPLLHSYSIEGIESRTSARVPRDAYGIREQSLAELKHRDIEGYNHLIGGSQ